MSLRVLKNHVGVFGIIILTFIPIIPWIMMRPLDLRFFDAYTSLTSLGQITGLLGTMLFAITLILSARLQFLEDYFGGLDRVYNVHRIAGTISFTLLLIHPLVLASSMITISIAETTRFFIPTPGYIDTNLGIFALLLMMSLLAVTFYAKIDYQYKRFLHKFLGVAFFLGVIHIFLIQSDVSQNLFLRFYILGFSGLALIAFLYRSIFGHFLVRKYKYIVSGVNNLGQGITEIVMSPTSERMNYLPGQFVFLSVKDPNLSSEPHPFSISSSPDDNFLRITIKALGDWTSQVEKLQVGSIAKIEGPFGSFSYLHAEKEKQIWVAGGIGITPFLNMLRDLRINQRNDIWVDFYYATRTVGEMIFRNEIEQIVQECPNIRLIPHASEDNGFLSADTILEKSGGLDNADIFVCGPPPMMGSLAAQFSKAKVPKRRVHMEAFKLL